jgi:hypothetical protein
VVAGTALVTPAENYLRAAAIDTNKLTLPSRSAHMAFAASVTIKGWFHPKCYDGFKTAAVDALV